MRYYTALASAGPFAILFARMGYEIRSLTTIEEFREHERLQRVIWDSDWIDVPTNLLAAGARHGAVVLGAYDGARMVGILYGFPAITRGRWHHHSHMLGVLPEYRRRGIGLALKFRQRELVLEQGLDLVTWTVDPLEVGNNLLNFGRLGVVCDTYIVNAYGDMDDALNRGLPSDRLEVEWHLSPGARPPCPPEARPQVLSSFPGPETRPSAISKPEASVVGVEVPSDLRALRRAHPDLALVWRLHLRDAFTRLFEAGYTLAGCRAVADRAVYVLCKQSSTA